MSPILFLDFDGVTHPEACRRDELFCRLPLIEAVLLRHPHVQVVISSSWREYDSLDELRTHFCQALRERVVGCTPLARQDPCEPAMRYVREIECSSWLQAHRPDVLADGSWLALDDVPWMFKPMSPHLLLTNHLTGFVEADAQRLEARLLMLV